MFLNNSVSNITTIGVGANAGGGLNVQGSASTTNATLTLTNVNFTNNRAYSGAGLEVCPTTNYGLPYVKIV